MSGSPESFHLSRPPTPIPERWATNEPEFTTARYKEDSDKLLRDALRPDPGREDDYRVPDSKFAFSIGQLNKLLNPKSEDAFLALGGLDGLEKGLRTDRRNGLALDEQYLEGDVTFVEATVHVAEDLGVLVNSFTIADPSYRRFDHRQQPKEAFQCRYRHFGDGKLPMRATQKPWRFALQGCRVELYIFVCALISLILSLYQDVKLRPENSRLRGLWKQDATIMILLTLVVLLVTSIEWFTERAEHAQEAAVHKSQVAMVVRSGKLHEVLWDEVFVGDLVFVQPGDRVRADGVIVYSAGLYCDESSATGESDDIRKHEAGSAYTAFKQNSGSRPRLKADPFMISGAVVIDGIGTYIVTSTGVNSSYGKILMALRPDPESLEHRLEAVWIREVQATLAVILFLILFLKFLIRIRVHSATSFDTALYFMQLTQYSLLMLLLALDYWIPWLTLHSRRWWKLHTDTRIIAKSIKLSKTLSKVSTICVDLDALVDHEACEVVETYAANASCTSFEAINLTELFDSSREQEQSAGGSADQELRFKGKEKGQLIWETSITATCYAREAQLHDKRVVKGVSCLQDATLRFAKNLGCDFTNAMQSGFDCKVLNTRGSWYDTAAIAEHTSHYPGYQIRAYFLGDPITILKSCGKILAFSENGKHNMRHSKSGETETLLQEKLSQCYAEGLAIRGFAYRDDEDHGLRGMHIGDSDLLDQLYGSLIFLGFITFRVKLQDGLAGSLKKCQEAGISIRLVTSESQEATTSIAAQCGILFAEGTVESARNLDHLPDFEQRRLIPRTCAFSDASPGWTKTLIHNLRSMRETVMTVGAADLFQHREADVIFAVGQNRASVVQEYAHMFSRHHSFDMVPNIILSSRILEHNQAKADMFGLLLTAVLVLLVFFSASLDRWNQSVLTPPQLVWIIILFVIFGYCIPTFRPPDARLWSEKPRAQNERFFSLPTIQVLAAQLTYQLAVVFTLTFAGQRIFNYNTEERTSAKSALVLSAFMWIQFFNLASMLRPRTLEKGALKRRVVGIVIACLLLSLAIILTSLFGDAAFGIRKLGGYEWAVSVILGFIAPVITLAAQHIPSQLMVKCMPKSMLIKLFQSEVPALAENRSYGMLEDESAQTKSLYGKMFTKIRNKLPFERDE